MGWGTFRGMIMLTSATLLLTHADASDYKDREKSERGETRGIDGCPCVRGQSCVVRDPCALPLRETGGMNRNQAWRCEGEG